MIRLVRRRYSASNAFDRKVSPVLLLSCSYNREEDISFGIAEARAPPSRPRVSNNTQLEGGVTN